jgi:hypothetical protein
MARGKPERAPITRRRGGGGAKLRGVALEAAA